MHEHSFVLLAGLQPVMYRKSIESARIDIGELFSWHRISVLPAVNDCEVLYALVDSGRQASCASKRSHNLLSVYELAVALVRCETSRH